MGRTFDSKNSDSGFQGPYQKYPRYFKAKNTIKLVLHCTQIPRLFSRQRFPVRTSRRAFYVLNTLPMVFTITTITKLPINTAKAVILSRRITFARFFFDPLSICSLPVDNTSSLLSWDNS